jgi:hypothetical protein
LAENIITLCQVGKYGVKNSHAKSRGLATCDYQLEVPKIIWLSRLLPVRKNKNRENLFFGDIERWFFQACSSY